MVVCDVELRAEDVDGICKKVRTGKVDVVRLQRCGLKVEDLGRIVEGAKLRVLDVSGNVMGMSGVSVILERGGCVPSTLVLDGVGIGDEGVELLVPHLAFLKSLSLANNGITSSGVMKLFGCDGLSLVSLNLSDNLVDDAAVFGIEPCVAELDLSRNRFTYRGLQILCGTLGLGNVETLSLNGNKFGSVSNAIACLYQPGSSIKTLYLRDCGLKRIPEFGNETNLVVLDVTQNIVPRFEVPASVRVVGSSVCSSRGRKVQLKFSAFDGIRKQVDELELVGAADACLESDISEVMQLMDELNAKLLGLRKKVKGRRTMVSLSGYAAKVSDRNTPTEFNELCDPTATGVTLESSFSHFTKIQILIQYLAFVNRLNQRSVYIREFRPSAFVWTDERKLVLKDESLLGYQKSDSGMSSFIAHFASIDPSQPLPFLHTLLLPALPVRPSASFPCERNVDSIMNLFRTITPSQLLSFHVSIGGESAVDHGGVLRDLLTDFWRNVSVSMFEMSDTAVSLLPKDEGDYRTLGRIMAKCLVECIPVPAPIHSIVFRFLCDQLPEGLSEWIDSIAEFDPQLAATIGYEAENDSEICDRCKDILVKRRKQSLLELKRGFLELPIINCITKNMMDWWTLSSEFIGEVEWTGEQLVDQLTFVGYFGNSRAKDTWIEVIKLFSKSDIAHFIRLLTGISSIPAGGFISRGKRLVISLSDRFFAHTCSFELESPLFEDTTSLVDTLQAAFTSLDCDNSMNEWYRN